MNWKSIQEDFSKDFPRQKLEELAKNGFAEFVEEERENFDENFGKEVTVEDFNLQISSIRISVQDEEYDVPFIILQFDVSMPQNSEFAAIYEYCTDFSLEYLYDAMVEV